MSSVQSNDFISENKAYKKEKKINKTNTNVHGLRRRFRQITLAMSFEQRSQFQSYKSLEHWSRG